MFPQIWSELTTFVVSKSTPTYYWCTALPKQFVPRNNSTVMVSPLFWVPTALSGVTDRRRIHKESEHVTVVTVVTPESLRGSRLVPVANVADFALPICDVTRDISCCLLQMYRFWVLLGRSRPFVKSEFTRARSCVGRAKFEISGTVLSGVTDGRIIHKRARLTGSYLTTRNLLVAEEHT